MQATSAGYQEFRRVFSDPSQAYGSSFVCGQSKYTQLWSYYENSLFDKASSYNWEQYKAYNKLYRNIRSLQNPCKQLVEFYVVSLYPGQLSRNGLPFKNGKPSAIPFSDDTHPALIDAIAQIWQWSNWQLLKSRQIRYCAALGDVLTEVVDDVERRKVYLDVCWPGHVKDLSLDHCGNIERYVLEYPVIESYEEAPGMRQTERYLYRKEVDKNEFRYYKDGQLYDYNGYGARVENSYGFVPATWTKHQDVGGDHGVAAIAGSEPLFDKLNELLCMIVDKVEQITRSPSVLWGMVNANALANTPKRGATSELSDQQNDQESVGYLTGQLGGHRESLVDTLDFAGVDISVGRLVAALEGNHPELTFWRQLREMSQVTGPAAARIVGDVTAKIQEAQANYDQQNMSLWRMAVAIAGFRANSGAWGMLTQQQEKFKPFDLLSYEQGLLDMAIDERPLLRETDYEHAQTKQTFWSGVGTAVQNAGVPLEFVLQEEGYSKKRLKELRQAQDDKEAQIQQDQRLASEDVIPAIAQ